MQHLRRFLCYVLLILWSIVDTAVASQFEISCGYRDRDVISTLDLGTRGLRRIKKFTYQSERCIQTQTHIELTPNCKDRVWCVDECTGCRDGDTFYEILSYYTGQHNPSWYQ